MSMSIAALIGLSCITCKTVNYDNLFADLNLAIRSRKSATIMLHPSCTSALSTVRVAFGFCGLYMQLYNAICSCFTAVRNGVAFSSRSQSLSV